MLSQAFTWSHRSHTHESLLWYDPLYVKVKHGANSQIVTEARMMISGQELFRGVPAGLLTAKDRKGTFEGAGDILEPALHASYMSTLIL